DSRPSILTLLCPPWYVNGERRTDLVPAVSFPRHAHGFIMSELSEFLDGLFAEGDVVFSAPPTRSRTQDPAAAALLRSAFEDSRRDLAGPSLPLRLEPALAAAELVRHACWFLVSHGEAPEHVERLLAFPDPRSPADHFSADLLFCYLPQIERRA